MGCQLDAQRTPSRNLDCLFFYFHFFYRHRSAATNRFKTLSVLKFYFYSFLIIFHTHYSMKHRKVLSDEFHFHCRCVNSLCRHYYDMLFVLLSLACNDNILTFFQKHCMKLAYGCVRREFHFHLTHEKRNTSLNLEIAIRVSNSMRKCMLNDSQKNVHEKCLPYKMFAVIKRARKMLIETKEQKHDVEHSISMFDIEMYPPLFRPVQLNCAPS